VWDWLVLLLCGLSFVFSWIESIFNIDSHHWGLMYAAALGIKKGLIAHSGVYLQYGILTSWFQALSFSVLGERLLSIGVVTGLFYSVTLLLSYRIFRLFLNYKNAFLAVLFLFLLHQYITYPWSSYINYTFFCASVYLYLKYQKSPAGLVTAGDFWYFR